MEASKYRTTKNSQPVTTPVCSPAIDSRCASPARRILSQAVADIALLSPIRMPAVIMPQRRKEKMAVFLMHYCFNMAEGIAGRAEALKESLALKVRGPRLH